MATPTGNDPLQASLREAQREVLEQEIFSLLIRDASVLPTSLVRVAERLLVVEATQDTEIWFELVRLNMHLLGLFELTDSECFRWNGMGLRPRRLTLILFREPNVI